MLLQLQFQSETQCAASTKPQIEWDQTDAQAALNVLVKDTVLLLTGVLVIQCAEIIVIYLF